MSNFGDMQCRLLQLPRELRDMIYEEVFSSSRLRHGLVYENAEWVDRNAQRHQRNRPEDAPEDWVLTEKTYRHVRPAPNTLALLRTCKQIHDETVDLWPKKVLFAYDTLETMLDRLSVLPAEKVSRIRNIQVSPAHTGVKRYPMASMLKIVPHLNLDTLTVVMNYASSSRQKCPDNLDVIDDFVKYGTGWRKLYFVTPDTLLLTSLRVDLDGNETRPPQPAKWRELLAERDWPENAASADDQVRIYLATSGSSDSSTDGAVFDPSKRQRYEQPRDEARPAWLDIEDRIERKEARAEDAERLRSAQRGDKAREVLVVVERRRGADVVERGVEPYNVNEDFRAWMGSKSWTQYWTGAHHVQATEESPDAVDAYSSPYQYGWVASERKGVTWPVRPPPRVVVADAEE